MVRLYPFITYSSQFPSLLATMPTSLSLFLSPSHSTVHTGDMLGIRLPVDFAILYQIAQSTSSTESYSEGFTLIASILHKIVSSTVSEQT